MVSVTCGFSGNGCIIHIAVLGVNGAGILCLFFLTIPSFFPPSIHTITTVFLFFFSLLKRKDLNLAGLSLLLLWEHPHGMVYTTVLAGRAQINYAVTLHCIASMMVLIPVCVHTVFSFFFPTGICCRTSKKSDEHAACRVWGYRDMDSVNTEGVVTVITIVTVLVCSLHSTHLVP